MSNVLVIWFICYVIIIMINKIFFVLNVFLDILLIIVYIMKNFVEEFNGF